MVIEPWEFGNLKIYNMADIDQEIDHTSDFMKYWNDPEQIAARKQMQEMWDKAIKDLEDTLSIEMVEDIRQWRCDDDHSWRSVARTFYNKYPEYSAIHGVDEGNQISGMMLCQVAQSLLKQENSEGWN